MFNFQKSSFGLVLLVCLQCCAVILSKSVASTFSDDQSIDTKVSSKPANILLVTVDDMNWDSVGAFGNSISDITPNIDQLANEGVAYQRAYVAASNCAPSRVAIQTGLYPQQSGARGFYYINDKDTPSLSVLLKRAGYKTGVMNKSTDTNPAPKNRLYWDYRSGFNRVDKYSASSYGSKTKEFLKQTKRAKKPFYLVVNIADPHKPNFNDSKATKRGADIHVPSRIIAESEVTVPAFLPDLPAIKRDIRNYYNSVKRADDAVGEIIKELRKSGYKENTLVIFLSDHGMPFPYSKSSVYDTGLRTPLVMSWPARIQPGTKEENLVSVIDLYPTILDAAGLNMPKHNHYLGKSLLMESSKRALEERNYVFGSFDENAHGYPVPMRGVISKDWNYVFNAWAYGEHEFKSATMNHLTFRTMEKHADKDPAIKARVDFYKYRTTEELCNLAVDPYCMVNLIDDPKYANVKTELQAEMRTQMLRTKDYLLKAFDEKEDPAALNKFMLTQHQQAKKRTEKLKWKRGTNLAGPTKSNEMLFQPSN